MSLIYPKPAANKRPAWAKLLAFPRIKDMAGTIASIAAAICIVYGFRTLREPNFMGVEKTITCIGERKLLIIALWSLLPPAWFWYEYMGLYRYEDINQREDREYFQYSQEVSSRIWIALVTVLTVLYFGKDVRG
jgi:hypothetical protein